MSYPAQQYRSDPYGRAAPGYPAAPPRSSHTAMQGGYPASGGRAYGQAPPPAGPVVHHSQHQKPTPDPTATEYVVVYPKGVGYRTSPNFYDKAVGTGPQQNMVVCSRRPAFMGYDGVHYLEVLVAAINGGADFVKQYLPLYSPNTFTPILLPIGKCQLGQMADFKVMFETGVGYRCTTLYEDRYPPDPVRYGTAPGDIVKGHAVKGVDGVLYVRTKPCYYLPIIMKGDEGKVLLSKLIARPAASPPPAMPPAPAPPPPLPPPPPEPELPPPPPPPSVWASAVDARGRTYYYNTETNETTWEKPAGF